MVHAQRLDVEVAARQQPLAGRVVDELERNLVVRIAQRDRAQAGAARM
jgi:hypothetical protein